MDSTGQFKGFSPRWTLPVTLSNVTNPDKNVSSIVLIIDSARESDRNVAEYFTKEIIGKSEMMVSNKILTALDI